MVEPSHAGLLAGALLACVAGMGWLALAMPVHAQQAWQRTPSVATRRGLRGLGGIGLMLALGLCLRADHPTMAVLVWIMALALGAVLTALTLAWRPRWLRVLAPWVGTGRQA